MLKKANRLSHSLFTKTFSVGKRIHNTYSTVVFSPSENFSSAVVVSKKIYKKAHERNLVRRRFYAVIAETLKNHKAKGVYIFIVKPMIKTLTRKEFKKLILLEVGRTLK